MSFSQSQVHSFLFEHEDGSEYGILYGIRDLDYPTRDTHVLEIKDIESGELMEEEEREEFIDENHLDVWDGVFKHVETL